MPPKQKIAAPIDRPLSRAYLREFSGWSTAYPPGVSEPTSLRIMENTMVNRDGSLRIRPGLRYLSYDGGLGIGLPLVGTHEAFYLNDGSRAYLVAVREANGTVGFRVLTFSGETMVVKTLTAAGVDFAVPQGSGVLNFSAATTYVKYVQIDNKIFALSNAGEQVRLFSVGAEKYAKALTSIGRPSWDVADKLTVVHPDAAWINGGSTTARTNLVTNPAFEVNTAGWSSNNGSVARDAALAQSGAYSLKVTPGAGGGDVVVRTASMSIDSLLNPQYAASVHVRTAAGTASARVGIIWMDVDNNDISETWSAPVAANTVSWDRLSQIAARPNASAVQAALAVKFTGTVSGDAYHVDAALFEKSSQVEAYFDGSTADTATKEYGWSGAAHGSTSTEVTSAVAAAIPAQETATPNTLVSSSAAANQYNYGFFYTFSNEVGESAASQVTVAKAQRAWTSWKWETPNAAGEPSGTETTDPERAADQLVAYMPESVFNQAKAQGAVRWTLYLFSWSDQDPVPIEGLQVATIELSSISTYQADGWARVSPVSVVQAEDAAPLPAAGNLYNYSDPSRAAQGIVAADRLVLVNDPLAAGTIKWTSSRAGEYLNFSAAKGGGFKTLSSGNMFVPATVKLWQNPESKDTLTVLCLGVDGYSTSYYMAPSQVASQSDVVQVMSFEETTATPGTTSPYGCEVLNNALYHPLETELMKSTAANYNINHKTMTDLISNMWSSLLNKDKIVSSQLDNRLYYIVHNRYGAALEDGCWGNEIWVLDTASKTGNWSRWKIQAQALRKIELGGRVVMSVVRPDGLYALDDLLGHDEYVGGGRVVGQRPIDWRIETNTQGANRAHDAWAHLQQANITLGNFQGAVKWGVRGVDLNGRPVDIAKVTQDAAPPPADGSQFDIEDFLLVRRDLREWFFYAESLPGEMSEGQISLVQYRYTPVSVNVGYEYGSVETFEYASNVAAGNNAYTANGVPLPLDLARP